MKITILFALLLMLASCAQNAEYNSYGNNQQNEKAVISSNEKTTAEGAQMKYATIEMDKGTIKAELYTEKAPITTKNFIDLAKRLEEKDVSVLLVSKVVDGKLKAVTNAYIANLYLRAFNGPDPAKIQVVKLKSSG